MIRDYNYWKRDLHKRAIFIDSKLEQQQWRYSSFSKLEQEIMLGFYSVRKLNEAKAIKKIKFDQPIELLKFSYSGVKIDHPNLNNIYDLYNMSELIKVSEPLSFITNQIIHSFVFIPVFSHSKKIHGILFNSDRTKNKQILFMGIKQIAEVFADIADGSLALKFKIMRGDDGNWYEVK